MADYSGQRKLQIRLIEALNQLYPHTKDRVLMKRVLIALNDVVIPEQDYEGVINILFKLLHVMPELLEVKTPAESLKKLMINCASEYKKLQQTTSSPRHHKN